MISLKKTITALDEAEALARAGFGSYAAALTAIRQYTLEVDEAAARKMKGGIETALEELERDPSPDRLNQSASDVRGLMREHYLAAEARYGKLRSEVSAASEELTLMVQTMMASGQADLALQKEVETQRRLLQLDDVQLRQGLARSVAAMTRYVEELRREKNAMIAQLNSEIRHLHGSIAQARDAAAIDPASGALRRAELDEAVREYAGRGQPCVLLYAWLRAYSHLRNTLASEALDEVVRAFAARLGGGLAPGVRLARWSDDEFVALLTLDRSKAVALSHELSAKLNGNYVYMDGPRSNHVRLTAGLGVVECEAGEAPERTWARIKQLAQTMGRAAAAAA